MKYAICEISGRQYLVKPGQIIEVDKLAESPKNLLVEKILLVVDEGKVEIGRPYLSDAVNFEMLGVEKKAKVRVATYKAKANYRRVSGQRREVSKIRLMEDQPIKMQKPKIEAKRRTVKKS